MKLVKFNYRIYVGVLLFLLVFIGAISVVSALAIIVVSLLVSIDHRLKVIALLLTVEVGQSTVEETPHGK